jgi:hypothetical protein
MHLKSFDLNFPVTSPVFTLIRQMLFPPHVATIFVVLIGSSLFGSKAHCQTYKIKTELDPVMSSHYQYTKCNIKDKFWQLVSLQAINMGCSLLKQTNPSIVRKRR